MTTYRSVTCDLRSIDVPLSDILTETPVPQLLPLAQPHAWRLIDWLSLKECDNLVALAERLGFGPVETDCAKECSAQKVMIESAELTTSLWTRIRPLIPPIEIPAGEHPHALHIEGTPLALEGVWQPIGLDTTFRLSRYSPGGAFAPHYDGFYAESPRRRTLISVVIYLRASQSGGGTLLLEDEALEADGVPDILTADSPLVRQRVPAGTGSALLFHHRTAHEGEPVYSGFKYIIRSDIMFERVSCGTLTPADESALESLGEAEAAEAAGDAATAAKLYRAAFRTSERVERDYCQ